MLRKDVTLEWVPEAEASDLELGKRTYLPYSMHWECSNCHKAQTRDFSSDYISHPVVGCKEEMELICPECDYDEDTVEIIVSIEMALA